MWFYPFLVLLANRDLLSPRSAALVKGQQLFVLLEWFRLAAAAAKLDGMNHSLRNAIGQVHVFLILEGEDISSPLHIIPG